MGYKITSYLFRNRFHRFYFRRAIPPDLSQHFSRRTLYKSLGTSERQEAVRRVAFYIALTEQAFNRIRQSMKSKDHLVQTELKMVLDLKELGSLVLELEPHEVEAGKQLIETTIAAAKGVVTISQPGKGSAFSRLLLSLVIEKYCCENEGAGIWSSASAKDYRGDFRQFVEIVGDHAIGDITREQIVTAKDIWLRLPPNLRKLPSLAGKSIGEVLALALTPQSAANVSKKWDRVRAFFGWAQSNSYVVENYVSTLKVKAKGKSYEKFTVSDLNALLCSDEYQNAQFKEPFQFWMPLIGLFTGARLEEIAQIHLSDVKLHGDRYFFHITVDDNGTNTSSGPRKHIKNESSDRVCPVHKKLIELGLLGFLADRKACGHERLFPELRQDENEKVGARASEWFTAYRRSKNVGQATGRSSKVFHSFRHTMNAALQALNVPLEFRELLCGHKSKSINVSVYGGTDLDQQLISAIDKLDYAMNFTAYKASD